MTPFPPSGPKHPCPVCGSAHQTCGAGVVLATEPQEEPERVVRAMWLVDGVEMELTAEQAARLGGVPVA